MVSGRTRCSVPKCSRCRSGNGVNSQNLLKLEYSYGTTQNNGNVQSQTITIPGVTLPFVQNYTYDSLNRLESAEEKPSGWSNCTADPTQCWKQTFKYDRYGNRNFNTAGTNTTTLPANFDPKIYNPTVSTTDNRFTSGQGYSYDSAGNTTRDAESRRFTYDAENKQTKVQTLDVNENPVSTIGEYFYDGDGKRVKKIGLDPTGQPELTVFVYDAGGKLIGEYSSVVQTGSSAKTVYTTNDHLGSPRINTDATGQVISRHDYHPFGEEIARTGYGSDNIRKQFTSYERDGETGLDYAQARYFAHGYGRFSSPDRLMAIGRASSPQTWNRYSYVGNNPLVFTDPTGLTWYSQQRDGEIHYEWFTGDPGKGWDRVTEFTYHSAKEGWVALDPFSSNFTANLESQLSASLVNRWSVALWNSYNSTVGFGDSFGPWGAIGRSGYNSLFGIDANVATDSTPHRSGWWIGVGTQIFVSTAAGGVAGAPTAGSSAATSLDDLAVAEANLAQAAGKTSGAAAAMETQSGQVFTGVSGGAATTNPAIRTVLDQVDNAPGFAGKCAEIRCIEQALDAGEDVAGATIRVVNIRKAGNARHGTVKAACPACEEVLQNFGIKPLPY